MLVGILIGSVGILIGSVGILIGSVGILIHWYFEHWYFERWYFESLPFLLYLQIDGASSRSIERHFYGLEKHIVFFTNFIYLVNWHQIKLERCSNSSPKEPDRDNALRVETRIITIIIHFNMFPT